MTVIEREVTTSPRHSELLNLCSVGFNPRKLSYRIG